MNRIGFDAFGYGPSIAAAKAAKVDFRTAYSSFDASKDLSAAACKAWGDANVWILSNFETTISRVFAGYAAGKADALHVIAEYKPRGMPEGAALVMSADESIAVGQFGSVLPYYQGAFDAAAGLYRVGCYGEQALIAYLKSHGVISIGWRSMSTSFPGGKSTAQCDIVQTQGGTIGGVSIDWNAGLSSFIGAWKPGVLESTGPASNGSVVVPVTPAPTRRNGENDMHVELELNTPVVFTNPSAVRGGTTALCLSADFGDAQVRVATFDLKGGPTVKVYNVQTAASAVRVDLPDAVNKVSVILETVTTGRVGLDVIV